MRVLRRSKASLPPVFLLCVGKLSGCSLFEFPDRTAMQTAGESNASAGGASSGGLTTIGQTASSAGTGGKNHVASGGASLAGAGGRIAVSGGTDSAGAGVDSAGAGGRELVDTGGANSAGAGGRTGENGGANAAGRGGQLVDVGGGGGGGGRLGGGGEGCNGSRPFPENPVALDDFSYSGPNLSSNWDDRLTHLDPPGTYEVKDGQLAIALADLTAPMNWINGEDPAGFGEFGTSQEVWATLSGFGPDLYGVQLWLKNVRVAIGYTARLNSEAALYVVYEFGGHRDLMKIPVELPRSRPAVLGGRAYIDGCVEVFADGTFRGSKYLWQGDLLDENPPPTEFYSQPGMIGVTAVGPIRIDDFGGGTISPP
ncbi:MAG TPA: hypothetical protein VFQ61_27975 [Polyangiaceae bacterium]|nr:hypothetical protein [Polyangiaceae bacterium]